jgi:hypothetical protein
MPDQPRTDVDELDRSTLLQVHFSRQLPADQVVEWLERSPFGTQPVAGTVPLC